MTHADRLQWRPVGHGGIHAYLGTVRIFSLSWGLLRNEKAPWNLRCDLPGYFNKTWTCVDEADARAKAARILGHWLVSTGIGAASQEPADSEAVPGA